MSSIDNYNAAKADYNAVYTFILEGINKESSDAWDDYKESKEEFGQKDPNTKEKLAFALAISFFKQQIMNDILSPRKAAKEAAFQQLPPDKQADVTKAAEEYKRRKNQPRERLTFKRQISSEQPSLSDDEIPF